MGEKEGELKFQIISNLVLLHKNTKLPVFLNLASSVEATINEAKKDFPKIRTTLLYESDDNWKVLNWLEKWFGS